MFSPFCILVDMSMGGGGYATVCNYSLRSFLANAVSLQTVCLEGRCSRVCSFGSVYCIVCLFLFFFQFIRKAPDEYLWHLISWEYLWKDSWGPPMRAKSSKQRCPALCILDLSYNVKYHWSCRIGSCYGLLTASGSWHGFPGVDHEGRQD